MNHNTELPKSMKNELVKGGQGRVRDDVMGSAWIVVVCVVLYAMGMIAMVICGK